MHLENYTNINIFKKAFNHREISTSKNVIAHSDNLTEGPAASHAGGFNPYTNNQGTTCGKQSTPNNTIC